MPGQKAAREPVPASQAPHSPSAEGDQKDTPGGDKTPQGKVPGDQPSGGGKAAGAAHDVCCCKSISLYLDSVTVTRLTDSLGGFPLLGKFVGQFRSDEMAIVVIGCDGKITRWPNKKDDTTLRTGENPINAELYTVYADAECHVECKITVLAYRGSTIASLLDFVQSLLKQLKALWDDLVRVTEALGQVAIPAAAALAAPLAGKLARASAEKQRLEQEKADIEAKIAKLEKQVNDELAKVQEKGEGDLAFSRDFSFRGYLFCDEPTVRALQDFTYSAQPADGKSTVTFNAPAAAGLGGDWTMHFKLERDCPTR